ncbi:glycosyltransferase [Acidobacteriia bacterium AH_259_A11_L15]|nr:glycosyltransferase [Acidobacteriia bacterium AH_259_A11_L15]
MIRVLNVLFDDRYGGPQKRAIQVARALAGRVETLLCLPDRSGNAAAIAEREGVAVRRLCFERIPRLRNWRQVARWFLHLPRDTRRFVALYRGEGPDVVHVNGVFFLPPALAAKLTRTPLVWHLNDTVMPAGLARVFGFVVRRLADQVVVSSRAVAGHYHVLGSQPEVLYPPVDPSALALPPRTRRDLQRTPYRIGLIANWNPEKGVEHFIRAAARVREQVGDNLELVFAGGKYASQADYCRRASPQQPSQPRRQQGRLVERSFHPLGQAAPGRVQNTRHPGRHPISLSHPWVFLPGGLPAGFRSGQRSHRSWCFHFPVIPR